MSNNQIPIRYTELFKLPQMGINPKSINFSTVTMESDKYICIREKGSQINKITVVDVASQKLNSNKITADSSIMNPSTRVLALKSGSLLQIFNLVMHSKMKEFNSKNEKIVFWTWISVNTIALITRTKVYHWSMEGDAKPVKVFDRLDSMDLANIINYRVDHSEKWCLLIGLQKLQNGSMKGVMQLYSVEQKKSQPIEGHSGVFLHFKLAGNAAPTTLISIAANTDQGGKLFIMEVPTPASANNKIKFQKRASKVQFSSRADFPVAMQASEKHGVIYMITLQGYMYMYDAEDATLIYRNRITQETIFVTAPYTSTNGLIGINRVGQVLAISIDENNIIPYIVNNLRNLSLAIRIASRSGLKGADQLFFTQFNKLLQQNQIKAAVKLAAESPNEILRIPQTVARLQQIQPRQGERPPVSLYFQCLIDIGMLNKFESVELAKIVVRKPGGNKYLKNLVAQKKLSASDELGDIIRPFDGDLAMKIYLLAGSHPKIIAGLVERGDYQKILVYCEKVGHTPDYLDILGRLLNINASQALKFALKLNEGESKLDPNIVVDLFADPRRNTIKQATAYLLTICKDDLPEQKDLQTRLLEINLMYSPPKVVNRILNDNIVTHYDQERIAHGCEKKKLYQRALENYSHIDDIKRVLAHSTQIPADFLLNYFETKDPADTLECLREMLNNGKHNIELVVQIATKYSDSLTPEALIDLFESFNAPDGLFYYLSSLVDYSDNGDIHFKYIQAAAKVGEFKEVDRVTKDSNFFDPEKTKNFLKEIKMPDQWPLINVCDRFGFEQELIHHLYSNNDFSSIEMYCLERSPLKTPMVVGALLDVDCNEDFIRSLLEDIGAKCPVKELVEEVESRNNRLKILLNWLQARVNEGNQEEATHNALAKIFIDTNTNYENFLATNEFYVPKVIGAYCENQKHDPHLAFLCYQKGQCDDEIIAVTSDNDMFKKQAEYLIERQDKALWAKVLDPNNEYRRSVIDEVIQSAFNKLETGEVEQVKTTVQSFFNAKLHAELIEILEKILLSTKTEFNRNTNFQNLLIFTAIQADKDRVKGYVVKLENYDPTAIAPLLIESCLFEEAFIVYQKFEHNTMAIKVLLENLHEIERAFEFAQQVDAPEVWSLLGHAQLSAFLISECIDSFLKAQDPSAFTAVIEGANQTNEHEALITYLQMARLRIREVQIETELAYAYAKTDQLAELEEYISGPNSAQIQKVGDRCFDKGLFKAAKILFSTISNYAKLSSALVKLEQYHDAVNSARKANNIRTWKEVNIACVNANEFRLAGMCGIHIMVHADELEELVKYYLQRGNFNEVIQLIESGLGHERAHMGMFTELGSLYSKFKPKKLLEHIKLFWRRINIPKLLKVCKHDHHWEAMRFLYMHYEEYDNALKIIMQHSPEAFDHTVFKETINKVSNTELLYDAIHFYLDEQPSALGDLLQTIANKVDNERVVEEVRGRKALLLIIDYLKFVQQQNLKKVNEALNDLYIQQEDYQLLRDSIQNFENFDQLGLARALQKHELLEFRRIASELYKKNGKFKESVALSKQDKLYADAMKTVAISRDGETAEELLKFFVDNGIKECFAACLFTCYDLIRPDVVLELAWKNDMKDFAMPYMIQVMREYTTKVDNLEHALMESQAQNQAAQNINAIQPNPNQSQQQDVYYDQQNYNNGQYDGQQQQQPDFFMS